MSPIHLHYNIFYGKAKLATESSLSVVKFSFVKRVCHAEGEEETDEDIRSKCCTLCAIIRT